MATPGSINELLIGAAGAAGGYEISRSLRFNSADSSYLSKNFVSDGNRKTWTLSLWMKRSFNVTFYQSFLINRDSPGRNLRIDDPTTQKFYLFFATGADLTPTPVYRDYSAWMHVVVVYDSTNATSTDRLRLYVNGERVTAFDSATYPTLNQDSDFNKAGNFGIGYFNTNTSFDGYLADYHFIDGQALDASSFGEFDDNGVWQPIAYSGTYGTNGFHLDFADNSSAAALGYDAAGSNDWIVNNLSVAAGSGNDSLVDSPTNGSQTDTGVGGEVAGNYCTMNPLIPFAGTISNGNLDVITPISGSVDPYAFGTFNIPPTGKWYWEYVATSGGSNSFSGVAYPFNPSTKNVFYSASNGQKYVDGTFSAYGATYTNNDVIGVAVDSDAGSITFYKNNVSQGSITYSFADGLSSPTLSDGAGSFSTTFNINFGQRPFAYTAPSGFKALCTTNLPEPTIADPSTVMDVKLYTGNGSTQAISGLGFSPDLVWIKERSSTSSHQLYDTIRGATNTLYSNSSNEEQVNANALTSFTSTGFNVGVDNNVNQSAQTYAAWAWDAGSSTVSNDAGSITSQVRANPSAGFSIVTYTGTGASATVGHGLGVRPVFMIIKNRSTSGDWTVLSDWNYPGGVVANSWANRRLKLNTTDSYDGSLAWNDGTIPTSTVFYLGSPADVNGSGNNFVAYCFSPVTGYSSFGSYTGNGSADGPFVYTGFRPAFVMYKASSTTGDWYINDKGRSGYNFDNRDLYPNASSTESSGSFIDILSNGFKARSTSVRNTNGVTYIYAAFAESPFAYSRAR